MRSCKRICCRASRRRAPSCCQDFSARKPIITPTFRARVLGRRKNRHYTIASNGWVRIEDPNTKVVTIIKPDAGKSYVIDPGSKTVRVSGYARSAPPAESAGDGKSGTAAIDDRIEPIGQTTFGGIAATGFRTRSTMRASARARRARSRRLPRRASSTLRHTGSRRTLRTRCQQRRRPMPAGASRPAASRIPARRFPTIGFSSIRRTRSLRIPRPAPIDTRSSSSAKILWNSFLPRRRRSIFQPTSSKSPRRHRHRARSATHTNTSHECRRLWRT